MTENISKKSLVSSATAGSRWRSAFLCLLFYSLHVDELILEKKTILKDNLYKNLLKFHLYIIANESPHFSAQMVCKHFFYFNERYVSNVLNK